MHRGAIAIGVLCIWLIASGTHWLASPTILLTYDNHSQAMNFNVRTVGELLDAHHLVLSEQDFVVPEREATLHRGMTIRVTRVVFRDERLSRLNSPLVKQRVPLKANLRPVLVERGSTDEERVVFRHVLHDGIEVSGRPIVRSIVPHPFFTLTLFDRKSGRPLKTYDLERAKKVTMLATAYYVGDPMVPGDETFLGYKLRRGLVAVDPKVIPLKSRLYVKGYGYAYAADTGSAIKGKRIDLAVADAEEEKRFNHRTMTIYILEKAKRW